MTANVMLGLCGAAYGGEASDWYIGGALLNTSAAGSLNETVLALPPAVSSSTPLSYVQSDTRSGGGRAYVGYRTSQHTSIEAGYTDLRRMSFSRDNNYCPPTASCAARAPTTGDIRVSGWHINVRGAVPVTDSLALTAKVGVLASTTKLHAIEAGIPSGGAGPNVTDRSSHRASPFAGIGVAYRLTPAVSATVEWERITRIGSRDTAEFTANVVSVGVSVGF